MHRHLGRVRRIPEAWIDRHRIDASLTRPGRERRPPAPPRRSCEDQPTALNRRITRKNYGYPASLRSKNETDGKSHPDARTVVEPRCERVDVAVAEKTKP
jgi:hypothetical protein